MLRLPRTIGVSGKEAVELAIEFVSAGGRIREIVGEHVQRFHARTQTARGCDCNLIHRSVAGEMHAPAKSGTRFL